MRHLFDQYSQPENRLTHALVSALANDSGLLKKFIRWATGDKSPISELNIVEQTLPGDEEPQDESEAVRRGLPDGWIYDTEGWCLVIESKIESPLNRDQLERHRRTAERRGFTRINLLALVTDLPNPATLNGTDVNVRRWADLYCWLLRERQSEWAGRLASYMEVLEQKLVRDNYLREGTLTVFAGIPFGKDEPYNYFEGKRLLRLAMDELRQRADLKEQLGMDSEGEGRSAITGRDGTRIWNFLSLRQARDAKSFTEFPHLTLGIHEDLLITIVTVPNGIRREFRRNLLAGGREGFCALFRQILDNLNRSLKRAEGAAPWVELVQRRYPSQRSEPILDARLQFDLRTAFDGQNGHGNAVKQQPHWLEAAYESLAEKNSNLQLGVGAIFPYDRCPDVHNPEILNHVANVWLGCKPLIEKLLTSETRSETQIAGGL
jgi:hypothetical protein